MNRCSAIEAQLSLYVDDQLDARATTEIRAHLDSCAACAGLVEDLARIAQTARLLGPVAPPAGLLASITAELPGRVGGGPGAAMTAGPPARRPWQWATLAATFLAALATVYLAGGRVWVEERPDTRETSTRALETVASELELAVHHYERAISELQTVAGQADSGLAPDVAVAVTASLRALDRAIDESRQALAANPASEPARVSLFEALRQKIDLLQTTALILNEAQEDTPAGMSRLVSGTGRRI